MIKKVKKINKDTTSYAYSSSDKTYKLQFSNNIKSLTVGNSKFDNNIKEQLINLRLNNTILELGPSSFISCQNLSSVTIGPSLNKIGDYCFTDCTMLTSIDRFNATGAKYPFTIVGTQAFKDTKIQTLNLPISSTVNSYVGDECFSNCSQLTSANLISTLFLSKNMFNNCANLKTVTFKDAQYGYIYPYIFNNCSSLTSITIPSSMMYISEGMFNNCTNLKKVDFANGSTLQLIRSNAFSGCSNLLSLTLPSSIVDLDQIDEYALSNSKINTLQFDGIVLSDLVDSAVHTTATLNLSQKWFNNFANNIIPKSQYTHEKIFNICMQKKIPVVCAYCGDPSYCSFCKKFTTWVGKNETLLLSLPLIYLYVSDRSYRFDLFMHHKIENYSLPSQYSQGDCSFLYNKTYRKYPDGRTFCKVALWYNNNSKDLGSAQTSLNIDAISSYLVEAGYNWGSTPDFSNIIPDSEITQKLKYKIRVTGSYGMNHDCKYISTLSANYPQTYDYATYKNDIAHTNVSDSLINIDYDTVSNFKYGNWYYNAKQVKEFADKNNIPMFLMFSYQGCYPCQLFETNIFKNTDFQAWIQAQPWLISYIETDKVSVTDDQFSWSRYDFAIHAKNYGKNKDYNDDNLLCPVAAFYWKKEDESTASIFWLDSYSDIDSRISSVGLAQTIASLENRCTGYFSDYISSDVFA